MLELEDMELDVQRYVLSIWEDACIPMYAGDVYVTSAGEEYEIVRDSINEEEVRVRQTLDNGYCFRTVYKTLILS